MQLQIWLKNSVNLSHRYTHSDARDKLVFVAIFSFGFKKLTLHK